MTKTTVLISGANRGIGKRLVSIYLTRPNHTIIAANRDPNHPTSQALADLPRAEGTSLIIVKVDATVFADAAEAVKQLESPEHGISHIDTVIANAAVAYTYPKVSELKIEDLQGHIVPNVHGLIALFQATLPLLKKSENPKWVSIGSQAGSLNTMMTSTAAYGPTKTMVHWHTKAMNAEEPWLTAFIISPGWVQTDMGNFGARNFGMEAAPLTMDETCPAIVKTVDDASREAHGGKFLNFDGAELEW